MAWATWLKSWRVGAFLYTIQSCTMPLHAVHVYLTVTCHLHLWQNYRDLLRATAVTRGCPGMPAIEISVSTESWPWRWNFSHRYCRFPFFSWFKNLLGISKNVIHCLARLPHLRSLDPRPFWAIGFQHLLRQSSYYFSSMVVEDEGCGTVFCRLDLDCEARVQRRKGSW